MNPKSIHAARHRRSETNWNALSEFAFKDFFFVNVFLC